MDKPKFSIVVPVYNAEGYLCKCLDSLLRQGLDSYEILLVNDGSTDIYVRSMQKIIIG